MVSWKKISILCFVLAGLIFIFYFFIGALFTPIYAPPDVMARESARRAREAMLVLSSIGILVVGGIVSFIVGKKQEKAVPSKK